MSSVASYDPSSGILMLPAVNVGSSLGLGPFNVSLPMSSIKVLGLVADESQAAVAQLAPYAQGTYQVSCMAVPQAGQKPTSTAPLPGTLTIDAAGKVSLSNADGTFSYAPGDAGHYLFVGSSAVATPFGTMMFGKASISTSDVPVGAPYSCFQPSGSLPKAFSWQTFLTGLAGSASMSCFGNFPGIPQGVQQVTLGKDGALTVGSFTYPSTGPYSVGSTTAGIAVVPSIPFTMNAAPTSVTMLSVIVDANALKPNIVNVSSNMYQTSCYRY